MAFVNEIIPDKDLERIDFNQVEHPFHHTPIRPYMWTVDREQDVALISLGGGDGETPWFFLLYWKGVFLIFLLEKDSVGSMSTNDYEIIWKMERTNIPDDISRTAVFGGLREALTCYGCGLDEFREKIKKIHFEF